MESFERESTAVVCIGTASDEKPAHSRPGSRGRECHHAIRSIRVTDLSISPVDLLASFFPPERMASLSLAMVEVAKSWYERAASAPLYYVATEPERSTRATFPQNFPQFLRKTRFQKRVDFPRFSL